MGYITNYEYYQNNGNTPESLNWGEYQYVSLVDVVRNFELHYVGNDKQINKIDRGTIIYHAKRGIQELNYDALRTGKILELTIDESFKMILPPDYVNFIRISLEKDGVLFPMVENKQATFATSYLQDNNLDIVFDTSGNVVEVTSQLDLARLAGDTQSIYSGDGIYNGYYGWCIDDEWFFTRQVGARFGMDPETANRNVTYNINKTGGVIDFSSDIFGMNVVLEYISDGMENGDDSLVSINKLAEEALYKYIRWAILDNKFGVPKYDRDEAKKQKRATAMNAKIRLSNMHPSRLLMVLRGQSEWVK